MKYCSINEIKIELIYSAVLGHSNRVRGILALCQPILRKWTSTTIHRILESIHDLQNSTSPRQWTIVSKFLWVRSKNTWNFASSVDFLRSRRFALFRAKVQQNLTKILCDIEMSTYPFIIVVFFIFVSYCFFQNLMFCIFLFTGNH